MPENAREPRIENETVCHHLFKTTIAPEKFEAVVARSCRSAFMIEILGSDPTVIPQPRLFGVNFTSLEDRDRVRIAMRFAEKEEAGTDKRPAPRPSATRVAVGA
jgi:hypothetical protein